MSTWPLENSAARVERVLGQVGWPWSKMFAFEGGIHNVQAAGSELNGTPALSHLQAVEAAEDGYLFCGVNGWVYFLNQNHPSLETSAFTFGDAPGEIAYQKRPDLGLDNIDLYNIAEVTRITGPLDTSTPPTQTFSDSSSETTYAETSTYIDSSSLLTTDADALARATRVVTLYSQPGARVRQIAVDPLSDPTVRFPAIVALDLVARVTVKRRPWDSVSQSFGAPEFIQDQFIEGITHEISTSPQTWKTTYTMFPAGPFVTTPIAAAIVHEATVQSIPDSTDPLIHFDSIDSDPLGMVSLSPNWTITIPAGYAGDYTISFAGSIVCTASGQTVLAVVYRSGTPIIWGHEVTSTAAGTFTSSGGDVVSLAVGDALWVIIDQVSGGSRDTDVSRKTNCFLSVSNV